MQKLPLSEIGSEVLRQPTRKVGQFDADLHELIERMRITMHGAKGVGLAAPQVGQSLKLAVIEYDPKRFDEEHESEFMIPFFTIVNPTITQMNDEIEIFEEGCLSIPDVTVPVPRATEVTVLALNAQGERIRIRAKDFLARILQHEIDHLHGVLITDRTTNRKMKKKYADL